jgi:glucose-6-phosphate isomerase
VGLFPLAVAGVDIHAFIAGAKYAEDDTRTQKFEENIAMQIAVMRYMAHKTWGKATEVYSTGVYDLRSTLAWFQQLGPESEGKNGEGLFVAPEFYTEMAHANGQLIRMGPRNLIETFLMVEKPGVDVYIPGAGTPVAYLDGKPLSFANQAFIEGLRDDHYEGGVPTMSVILPQLDAFTMGAYFQYMMNAIALSGLLLSQYPFIQPGVQGYKDVANARSGKPGTEAALAAMLAAEAGLNPRHII